MARALNKLTPMKIAKLQKTGRYGDGGGLWLQVSQWGTKAWLFRYMLDGRAREMGFGPSHTVTLAEAREKARQARQMLLDGLDPIAVRDERRLAARAADAKRITFNEAAKQAVAVFRDEWRNSKHGEQWTATLTTYAGPIIGKLSVAAIDTGHIEQVLRPIWLEKHETASRLRQRIERVLRWATAAGYRSGDNPAALVNVGPLLASGKKVKKVRHQPAMPYAEVPAFVTELRENGFISARALEFTILTAGRTGEIIGARWPEIDFDAKVWTVPAKRMKAGREHRVPLSKASLDLLVALPREGDGRGYVFPGAHKDRPLSNMAMLQLLRGMTVDGYTVHGFRSSFRDWAAEQTNYARDLAEAALAHVIGDKTEAAYRRGDAIEKRRKLMQTWADFCARPHARQSGNVVAMRAG
jgi:integrase